MLRTFLVAAILLAVPAASAQGAVYATSEDLTGSTAAIRYSASHDLPAAGKAYSAFGQGGTTYATTFDYPVRESLSPGVVQIKAYLTCDEPTFYRPVTTEDRPSAKASLLKGATVVGSASLNTLRTCDGPTDVWEAVFEIDATAATFVAGDVLSMEFTIWWATPPPGPAQNAHFLVGGAKATGVFGSGLPGDPVLSVPDVITGDLNGTLDHSFDEATTRSYVFAYNSTMRENITFSADVQAGAVAIDLLDADGVSIFNATEGAFNGTLDGTAGNWTLHVDYTDFIGQVVLGLTPFIAVQEPSEGNTTMTPGNGTAGPGMQPGASAGGNETGDPAPGEKSPGLPLVMVLAALFLARRRL